MEKRKYHYNLYQSYLCSYPCYPALRRGVNLPVSKSDTMVTVYCNAGCRKECCKSLWIHIPSLERNENIISFYWVPSYSLIRQDRNQKIPENIRTNPNLIITLNPNTENICFYIE